MADLPKYLGHQPPHFNANVYTFTRRIGKTIESSALVTQDQLASFLAGLEEQDFSYHAEPHTGTPYALVTWIPYDSTETIADIWEFAGNDIEKDAWELPKVVRELGKLINAPGLPGPPLPGEDMGNLFYQWHAFLMRVVNGKVNGEEKVAGWQRDEDGAMKEHLIFTHTDFQAAFAYLNNQARLTGTGQVDYRIFAELAACLSRGVTSFPVGHYVVRRTRSLPPGSTIRGSIPLANVIFTKAEFITIVNSERPALPGMPPEIESILPDGYYQYKSPTETSQRDGTWLLNEEWYWATNFDHFIYGNFGFVGP